MPKCRLKRAPGALAFCWLGAVLSLPVGASLAQEGPRPTLSTGSRFEYTGRLMSVECAVWTVGEVAADGATTLSCAGNTLETDGANDGNAIRVVDGAGHKLVEFRPFAPTLKFPLTVGGTWRQGYVGYTGFNNLIWDGEAQCKVVAYEPLQVAAGSFDTFRIECQDKWMVGPRQGVTHVTRWYAPAVGTVVKQQHREDPAHWNFELSAYTPPIAAPAQAVMPAPAATPVPRETPAPAPVLAPDGPDILDPNEY